MKKYTLNELFYSKHFEKALEKLPEYQRNEDYLFALLELKYGEYNKEKDIDLYTLKDLENAVKDLEKDKYYIYKNEYEYFDSLDELIWFDRDYDWREQYFDFDSYHEDNMGRVEEASNKVLIETL